VPSFAVSICVLTLVQSVLVTVPAAVEVPLVARFRGRWWR